jgi:hypothetical protein
MNPAVDERVDERPGTGVLKCAAGVGVEGDISKSNSGGGGLGWW